ncbi:methylenetetrahydrofolate reductase [NAD(P)H] [Buchnera aphidicola]|uniref:methylenetetrahydrofolate reductase [NAD(P)H] n=1 Tax=Buchnera aphidicola TaxID=9 RepID=UPI0022389341|nr:methylenetetrahydrofolate reductase [NAD(P)H] [Buchnera aphidicola]MCW5197388.1 methylenetetrahydrofolate reductase [NAD(P)H] [Buchnera aphidicola (Chaitophorus viminalis)]
MNLLNKHFMKNKYKNYSSILNKINLSFEFFPPSKLDLNQLFWFSIKKLSSLNPIFMSVTYGANNGNKDNTYNFVKKLKSYTKITSMPHMTCVHENKSQLKKIAVKYWKNGIKHILALRGDYPDKNTKIKMYAKDLVILLKKIADFKISVAAYPEIHPESKSLQSDLMYLKDKIESGAHQAITQFFFDIDNFLRFRDRCLGVGITAKIIPGILPIKDFNQVYKFCLLSNIYVPNWIKDLYLKSNQSVNEKYKIGYQLAINMIQSLYKEGVYDFHLYTLNKSDFIYSICNNL